MMHCGLRCVFTTLLLLFCLTASRSALASNPTVPQGGHSTFAQTNNQAPASGLTWDIKLGTTTVATSSATAGWTVTYSQALSSFTVGAPSNATIASNYLVRYAGAQPLPAPLPSAEAFGTQNAHNHSVPGASANFDVIAMPAVYSLAVSPTSVIGGVTNASATVTLGSVAPTGNVVVSLSSSNTSAASVPSTVTVNAGSTSANFTVTTYTVSSAVNVTLTASFNGSSATATLRVVPQPSLSSVTLNPTSVTGATSSTGTVTLSSEAPSGGIAVSLSDSNSNTYSPPASSVPASVTVTAGATTATFTVTTNAVPAVTTATITGTYHSGSQSATLTINPPVLSNFTLSASSVRGGQDVTATLTLNGPAPTGGAGVSVTCSNLSAANVQPNSVSFPTTLNVLAGQTSANFDFHTSTVNYPITITFTATYNATLTANLTLTQANLWVTDIYQPSTLALVWNVSASGNNFKLTRSIFSGGSWSVQATFYPTSQSYNDVLGSSFVSGQSYLYQLYDNNTNPPTLLAQEQVAPYQSNTTEDQTVDSRIDPRYSTLKYLDFQYGSMIYRGGLYVGYMQAPQGQSTPPDSSRIGRSFAKFPLSAYPSGGSMRAGDINAYFTGCNTDQGAASVQVGCQPLSSNSWVGSTLTWDTAPSVTPSNATSTKTVSSSDTPSAHWVYWPMTDIIKNTLTGSQLLSVAWASMNEPNNGNGGTNDWAYFAKQEYDSTLSPCAMYVYDLPSPTSLTFSANPAPRPGTVFGYVTVNGLGPGDQVTVTIYPGYGAGFSQTSLTVSGLNNPAAFTLNIPSVWGSTQFFASCNNVSIGAWLY